MLIEVSSGDLDGNDGDLDNLQHQLPRLPASSSVLLTRVHEEVFEFPPEALHLLTLLMGQRLRPQHATITVKIIKGQVGSS